MASVNWSNVTDLAQLPGEANTAASGGFWSAVFYMLWVVLILLFVGYGTEVAVVVSSFIALVIGIMLVYAGLMAWEHLISVLAVLLFSFLYIIWTSPKVKR